MYWVNKKNLAFALVSINHNLSEVAVPDGLLHLCRHDDTAEDGGEEVDKVPLGLRVAQRLLQALQQLLQVLEWFEVLLVNGLPLQNGCHILVVVPKEEVCEYYADCACAGRYPGCRIPFYWKNAIFCTGSQHYILCYNFTHILEGICGHAENAWKQMKNSENTNPYVIKKFESFICEFYFLVQSQPPSRSKKCNFIYIHILF